MQFLIDLLPVIAFFVAYKVAGIYVATGVLIAGLQGVRTGPQRSIAQDILDKVGIHGWESYGATADIISIVMFTGLCFLLLRAAQKKLA